MEKGVKITGIIGITIIIVVILILSFLSPSNTISVNGQSQVEAIPDLVTVNFNIESIADTAVEAKDKNSEIYNNLVEKLEIIGIDDVKTSNFNVYPEYDWEDGNRVEKGYKATHFVTVELPTEESEKISEVIDAGVNAGALISYINFELSEYLQKEKKSEAIIRATEDAKDKAEAMAEGLGKKLGKIISVSDSNFDYNPWPLYSTKENVAVAEAGAIAMDAVQSIHPDEQIVYGSVAVVYKLG